MRLSTIFEHLTHGPLSNLSVGQGIPGEVAQASLPKLITLVNAGLVDLYTRFALRTRDIAVQLSDGKNIYPLTSDFAESNIESVETKYIMDGTSTYPFTDDIISIDAVYNELGTRIPLNDSYIAGSIMTPEPNVIQVPYTNRENMLAIVYRALPKEISTSLLDPTLEEVAIPYHFIEALISFISWKMYTPIDGADNPQGLVHQGNYLKALSVISQTNTGIEDAFTNQRFEVNGWL